MNANRFTINSILTTSLKLRGFVNKAQKLITLNGLVPNYLDPILRSHCRVTNYEQGVLVMITPSPAVGHQLRLQSLTLLSTLRAHPEWCGLKSIKVKVRPDPTYPNEMRDDFAKNKPKRRVLTENSAELLKMTALSISNLRLKTALNQLSKHGTAKKS